MIARYLLKRLGQTVLVLFFVSVFAFFLVRLAPGNPALMVLGDGATDEAIEAMEIKMGLDKPLYVQYFKYIGGVLRGDLGVSTSYGMEINKLVASRFPNTLKLTLATTLVGCLISIPLGIVAATHKGSIIDYFAMLFALLGQSMANMWRAVLFIYIFAVTLGWLPSIGSGGLKYYILPAISLGWTMAAEVTRMGRSGMIDTLNEDYIVATRAKGIKSSVVNWKYAFKNALCPVVTLIGLRMGAFLAGAIIIEAIFSWPGIGQLLSSAVSQRDYQLVQSLLLVSGAMFALINFLTDIINSLIDPRISLE